MRVRVNNDAGLAAPGLNSDPHFSDLFFENATTPFAVTTPTSATAISSTSAPGLTLGEDFGGLSNVAAGTFTATRAGRYRLYFNASEVTAVASQVMTVEFYKNGAPLARPIKVKYTQGATAVEIPSLVADGIAQLVNGDVVTCTIIASTGNWGAKRCHIGLCQLSDVALAVAT